MILDDNSSFTFLKSLLLNIPEVYLTCNFQDYDEIPNSETFLYPTIIVVDKSSPLTKNINSKKIIYYDISELEIKTSIDKSRWVKSILLSHLGCICKNIIYHDFNIQIKSSFSSIMVDGLNIRKHPTSRDLKTEIYNCSLSGKLSLIDHLKSKNLNQTLEVYECNIIGLKGCVDLCNNFRLWYNMFLMGIKRDQFYFTQSFHCEKINIIDIGDIRSALNNYVKYIPHDTKLSLKKLIYRKIFKIILK